MDGNMAMAPRLFTQLHVIRVLVGDTYCQLSIDAFLQHKTQQCYQELLQTTLNKCRLLLLFPCPQTIVVDFERTVINAIHAFCFE